MAEVSRKDKDVKAVGISKQAFESGIDLSGLRMGKTRLVSKKKKKSALKKVILEEREETKQLGTVGSAVAGRPLVAGPASALSLDAPEFVPSGWSLPGQSTASAGNAASKPEEGEGATQTPGDGEGAQADSGSDAAEASATPAGSAGASGSGATSSSARLVAEASISAPSGGSRSSAAPRSALQAAEAPVFMPSWCQAAPAGDGPAPEDSHAEEEHGELPIAEAIARLRTGQDEGKRRQEKQKQPQKGADIEVRPYVHQVLSDELDEKVKVMLGELVRFQERAKEKDPLKYEKNKRFCVGMREAKRAVLRKKAKCLILAPNLEASTAEGGLDETVEDLIEAARENEVPVVFALSRNRIGKAIGKNIRLSIVAVVSAEGVHQEFKQVLKLVDDLRRQWVIRQMSRLTAEDAEESRKRAEEKAARDVARRQERIRLEAERKADEERQRIAAKEAKAAEKARKEAERKAEVERRRAEKAARANDPAVLAEKARLEAERKAEEERRAAEEKAREAEARKAERARRSAALKAEEERKRKEEEARAAEQARKEADRAARIAAGEDDESSGSDVDLPAGFNDDLF